MLRTWAFLEGSAGRGGAADVRRRRRRRQRRILRRERGFRGVDVEEEGGLYKEFFERLSYGRQM